MSKSKWSVGSDGTPVGDENPHFLKKDSRDPLVDDDKFSPSQEGQSGATVGDENPHIPKRAIWEAPMLTKYPQFLMLGAPIGNEKSSLPQKARSEKFGNLMFPPKMYPGLIF